MALNLIRNARMFFTTNVDATTGVVLTSGFDNTNTREIQVLDGLSFSQATGSETVTVNEAGTSPVRGQRLFNTSLDPVEISFSTYMRPYFNAGASGTSDDQIDCEESELWNAFATGAGAGTDAWAVTTGASPVSKMTMAQSAKNQLKAFGLIVILDQTSYIIDNCALDQATIDFGLDAISTIAWTARGTVMRNIGDSTFLAADKPAAGTDITFSGSYFTSTSPATDTAKNKNTQAAFLANKLSQVALSSISVSGAYGGGASTTYQLALTGGSITLANNITYLTPANLGVVNTPVTYFTGTRAVSGTLNCYLKTGSSTDSGALLDNMLDNSSNVEPAFALTVHIGGSSSTKPRVSLVMPSVVLQIPTVNTEQVVSTAINFTAQGLTSSAFDLAAVNEIEVQYYAQ